MNKSPRKNVPDMGIELGPLACQANSLPIELPRPVSGIGAVKSICCCITHTPSLLIYHIFRWQQKLWYSLGNSEKKEALLFTNVYVNIYIYNMVIFYLFCLFIQLFICIFNYLLIYLGIYYYIHFYFIFYLLIYILFISISPPISFIYSFIHSFIHSFISLFNLLILTLGFI